MQDDETEQVNVDRLTFRVSHPGQDARLRRTDWPPQKSLGTGNRQKLLQEEWHWYKLDSVHHLIIKPILFIHFII